MWNISEKFKRYKILYPILIGGEETFDKIWQLLMTNLLTNWEWKWIHNKSTANSSANDETLKALLLKSEIK